MATRIITPTCGKQGTAKGHKATNRTEGPQSAIASDWRALATSARDAACALMQAAEDRSDQEMDVECFLRLMRRGGDHIGQFQFGLPQSMQECENVVFDTMAMIKGALHVPEAPDDVARSLAAQAYEILDTLSLAMTDDHSDERYARAARAVIVAAADVHRGDLVAFDDDRRALIRDSICEVMDWNDMVARQYGESDLERLAPTILQRISVLSSCVLDAVDDQSISTKSIQQRIDGKAVL